MLTTKKKNYKLYILTTFLIAVLSVAGWFMINLFESENPTILFDQPIEYIGKSYRVSGKVFDRKTGIRKIFISIFKDGKDCVLLKQEFPALSYFGKGSVNEHIFEITIVPDKLWLADGKGILKIGVWDYSWRNWWTGNQLYIENNIIIDTKAPSVEVLSNAHNINQGGVGLVIYRVSEQGTRTGVQVGNEFFKGYSGLYTDPLVYISFITLGYDQDSNTQMYITAEDQAGNRCRGGFYYRIKRKNFKKSTVDIDEAFLKWKTSELQLPNELSDVDKYLKINNDIRKEDENKIINLCNNTTLKILWQDEFLRLPKAANKSGFGEVRTYFYHNKKLDVQTHYGVDLASVAHSPIPAANAGNVVYAGDLHLYGKTIIIDHGFGLFSMYAHLSSMNVEVGQAVSKSSILGNTGSTGMAGGDHLHFSMIVQGHFCNPIEWWDPRWIMHNITDKINSINIGKSM